MGKGWELREGSSNCNGGGDLERTIAVIIKGGYRRWEGGGFCREPLPNTMQVHFDTYLRCSQTGLDTYQKALCVHSNIAKP